MTEVRKLQGLVLELSFWGNFIIILKSISARNLKNTLKPSKNNVWRSKQLLSLIFSVSFWPLDRVFYQKQCSSGFWPRYAWERHENHFKSKFSTHFVQIPYHLHPARQGAHPALSNSLSIKLKVIAINLQAQCNYVHKSRSISFRPMLYVLSGLVLLVFTHLDSSFCFGCGNLQ